MDYFGLGMKHICGIIILSLLLAGCDIFRTGNPESPDTGKSTYVPPTSPSILIDNFKSAIQEKNLENYISCLADSSLGRGNRAFEFVPSAEAKARYFSIFYSWNLLAEQKSFTAILANMDEGSSPLLVLANSKFEAVSPDSTIYTAEYSLTLEHAIANFPKHFIGNLQFTLHPNQSGLWSITRWVDLSDQKSDTTSASWSILKAHFYN